MKAVQINAYGGPNVLEIVDVPKPTLKKGQIQVEVYAVSINPFDWKVREGFLKDAMPLALPSTIGEDFSGVVIKFGQDVSEFTVGDAVYGQSSVFGGESGAFAEFVSANTNHIAKKPNSVNFEEAAALRLVGVSTIQALEDTIKLTSGQKILIHGGAGGIGSVAIQLAKAKGAYVATTVSAKDVEFVKNLGADEVIDYKTQKFEDVIKDFDAVYDLVGGQTLLRSYQVLKRSGMLVTMTGSINKELADKYGVTSIGQFTKTTTDRLNRLTAYVDSGKIKVHIDKVFPLDQIKDAFIYQETGHPQGKVVVKIKE